MRLILKFHDEATAALEKGVNVERLVSLPVREKIGRFKYIEESNIDAEYKAVFEQTEKEIKKLISQEEV